MKSYKYLLPTCSMGLLTVLFSCTSKSEVEPIPIDPIVKAKVSSIAVIDVSTGLNALPTQYRIDGSFSSNIAQTIGSNKTEATYIPVEAGIRKISIGSYSDTLNIKESNYYTVMVYDKDSVRLSLDAPYTSNNGFRVIPQVRWNIVGADSKDYKVEIMSDSLLRDIKANVYTPVSTSLPKVEFYIYAKTGNVLLWKEELPIKMDRKETVNIIKDPATKAYTFQVLSQIVPAQ